MAVAADYTSLAQELYIAYFGRPADVVGLSNMTKNMAAGNVPSNTADFVAAYSTNSTVKSMVDSFGNSTESANLYGSGTTAAFVNAIYQNLLNRAPLVDGLLFWVNAIDSGALTKGAAAMNILAAAVKDGGNATDLANVSNKVTVATNFTTTMSTDAADIVSYAGAVAAQDARDMLKTVVSTTDTTTFQATIDSTLAAIVTANNPVVNTTLTVGVDNLVGTSANDTYNGTIGLAATNPTLSALDTIDGKTGQNVLNISDVSGGTALPGGLQISNVQTVNVQAAGAATIDTTTGFTGLKTLNVTRSTGNDVVAVGDGTAVNVTDTKAAATVGVTATDSAVTVNAAGKVTVHGGSTQTVNTSGGVALDKATGAVVVVDAAQGGNDTTITHGTSVSLTTSFDADSEGNGITIGSGGHNPTGAVTVVANIAGDKTGNQSTNNIAITGGTVVTVTENATQPLATAPAAGATATNFTLTQAAVGVTGTTATTTVSVTQTAEVSKVDTITAKTGVVEADSFKFAALTVGQTLIVDGLTFTAGAAGTTAAQTAAAFANLTKTSTQGNSVLGTYSGTYGGNFTTGAVTGTASDTVVFSYKSAAAVAAAAFTGTGTAPTGTNVTTGVNSVDAQAGVGGIAAGAVTVTDVNYNTATAGTINNVKLDAYHTGSVIKSDALATLSLANATDAAVTVDNHTAKTLGLTVNNLAATTAGSLSTLNLDNVGATYTTLNVHTAGAASTVNVTAAGVQTLTVDGAKSVDLTGSTFTALKTVTISGAAGVTAAGTEFTAGGNVTDVNAAASSGANTIAINANQATYEGGSGVDTLTLSSTTVSKAVSLGAGDDKVTLASGTTALTATIDGGTGTDTLVMTSANAATATGDTAFEAHITGFEKLGLTAAAAGGADTINLANLNNISYVVSAGGAGTTESAVVTWKAFSGAGTQTIGGMTVTATGSFTAAQVATVAGGGTVAGLTITTPPVAWTVAAASGATNVFTSTTANTNVANVDLVAPAVTTAANNTAPTAVVVTPDGVATKEVDTVTWQAFADAGTQSIGGVGGVTITATGAFTAAQVASAASGVVITGLTVVNGGAYDITAAGATTSTFTEHVAGGGSAIGVGSQTTVLNTAATAVTTDGAAVGTLALTHMANAGTFELNGNASSTTVTMTDATGTADSFNVLLKGAAIAGGTVAVANVETVNVTATDTNAKHDAGTISDSLTVSDAAVTAIKVLGNANLTLTVTGDTALTSIDASGMTAGLTVTTAGTVAETVKGGAMANHLTAGTGTTADVLIGGAAADVLTANAGRDVLTGGAGNDTFVIQTASVNVNSYATITDAAKGDIIQFLNTTGTETFKAAAISLDTTASFQDYANAAVNENNTTDTTGHISWFQFAGNTYVVESNHDASSLHDFKNGTDLIVKLTGTVDLSHTSLNTTNVTLLIG
ncbi:beta strand repeat-containing protein [Rugamonas apoptosis]|uniref:DUF4214 domain-containing protein n=1 Tax=Rugamonas apoptosis TaxID=2758570 RepID=A0A7W2FA78_9BURK|nr:DUF4214 domain-containing protein [Rugamonas apoptosis]MBA5687985.1 DUF4214 domain-containing protein [Rugamonas apoptosis]